MKRLLPLASCLALMAAVPLAAHAQTPNFSRCTTANFFGGAATAKEMRQALFGGAAGWEMTPRLSAEMTTKWLVPEGSAEAFSAIGTLQMAFTGRQRFVPFLTVGAGVHHASFDVDKSEIPEFYARRLTAPAVMTSTRQTFTDPAVVAGGGVSIFASRHVSVRPEIEVMLVPSDSETYVMTSFTVRFAYRFELHRVTPDRRAK